MVDMAAGSGYFNPVVMDLAGAANSSDAWIKDFHDLTCCLPARQGVYPIRKSQPPKPRPAGHTTPAIWQKRLRRKPRSARAAHVQHILLGLERSQWWTPDDLRT